jgi:hypothetical protein|tara:strand:- start:128 stop:274 length:147 start_codon:yes stop_codon:yes gene_type:complete
MVEQLASYASIIVALAMVNVVWQLDKAAKLLHKMSRLLGEAVDEHDRL